MQMASFFRYWSKPLASLLVCLGLHQNILAQAADDTPAKGVLWEVKSATNTAYLFGSIHLAKASFYPLPPAVQSAYAQADTIAVEIDSSDPQAMAQAMPLLTYTAPDNLQQHLQASTWKKLQHMTGPAAASLQNLKPAIVATGLMVGVFAQQGYDPKQGIDLHFIERAKRDHKTVTELESMEFQARILGGFSDEDGDAMLAQTLDSLSNGDAMKETDELVRAWKSGDARQLVNVLEETASKDAGSRKLMKLLLDDRNPAMAEKIVKMMDSGQHVLIVVGAGHIAGKNSLTEILQKRGLQVRQIPQ